MPIDRAISLHEFLEDPHAKKPPSEGSAESSADILIAGSSQVHEAIEQIDHERTSFLDLAIRHKKRAGRILNEFASLKNLSRDEILTSTEWMYQKWAFALLRWWLFRVIDEAPAQLPDALTAIVHSAIIGLKTADESVVDKKIENIRKVIRLIDQCVAHVDEMDQLHPEHFSMKTKASLFSVYGYLEQYCKGDNERAEVQYRDAIALNDPKGYVLLGSMYRENGRFEEGTQIVQDGWRNAGSFECLLVLMQDDYEAGRVGEAAEKWNILRTTSFPMTQRSSFITEFKFPRDLRLFQIEGQYGEVMYDPELRSRAYDALEEALGYKWQDQTDAALFRLPLLQLSAIEFVNFEWAKNYLKEIKMHLESWEPGRQILRSHFEYFTSERARQWFITECDQHSTSFSEELIDTVDWFNWLIHWHLSAVVKSFLTPDAIEIAELFAEIAQIMGDDMIIGEANMFLQRIGTMKSNLESIDPEFEQFYNEVAEGVSGHLWSRESRDIITSQLLSGTWSIRYQIHPMQLVYIIMNAVLFELDKVTVYEYLARLPKDVLTQQAYKAMGQLFYGMGYIEDALYFYSQADLADILVVAGFVDSALDCGKSLSLAFEGLARRADAVPGMIPDVRETIKNFILDQKIDLYESSTDYLTLLGSANILYGDEKLGLQDLQMARAMWSIQALKRLAEYEFYVLGYTGAEKMYIELQDKTNDTKYFVDLMRIALARGDRIAAYDYLRRCEDTPSIERDLAYLQYYANGTDAERRLGLERLLTIDSILYKELDSKIWNTYVNYIDKRIAELAEKTSMTPQEVHELLFIHRINALIDVDAVDPAIAYFETIRLLLLSFWEKAGENITSFLDEQKNAESGSITLVNTEDADRDPLDAISAALQIEGSIFIQSFYSHPEASYICDAIGHMFRDGLWAISLADDWYALSRKLQKKMTIKEKLHHILVTKGQPGISNKH